MYDIYPVYIMTKNTTCITIVHLRELLTSQNNLLSYHIKNFHKLTLISVIPILKPYVLGLLIILHIKAN